MGGPGKGFMTIAIWLSRQFQEIVFCGLMFFLCVGLRGFLEQCSMIFLFTRCITARPLNQNSVSFAVISKMMCRLKQERGLPARERRCQVSWEPPVPAGVMPSLGADLQYTTEVSGMAAVVVAGFGQQASASQTNPKW